MKLERTNCNICKSNKYCVIQYRHPFKIVKCRNCGLVYINPRPNQRFIKAFYLNTQNYADWEQQKKARYIMWKKRAAELDRIIKRLHLSGTALLDIGCGIGTFLEIMQNKGYSCMGTEISAKALKNIRNIRFFEGNLEVFKRKEKFSIITMWHVLEHLPNPLKTLKTAKKLLKKDGLLVAAVPNVNDWIFPFVKRIITGKKQYLFSKESKEIHLYHFSQGTLKKLLKKAGFRIIKMGVDTPGTSFLRRCFDDFARIVFAITRRNIGRAIIVYARVK